MKLTTKELNKIMFQEITQYSLQQSSNTQILIDLLKIHRTILCFEYFDTQYTIINNIKSNAETTNLLSIISKIFLTITLLSLTQIISGSLIISSIASIVICSSWQPQKMPELLQPIAGIAVFGLIHLMIPATLIYLGIFFGVSYLFLFLNIEFLSKNKIQKSNIKSQDVFNILKKILNITNEIDKQSGEPPNTNILNKTILSFLEISNNNNIQNDDILEYGTNNRDQNNISDFNIIENRFMLLTSNIITFFNILHRKQECGENILQNCYEIASYSGKITTKLQPLMKITLEKYNNIMQKTYNTTQTYNLYNNNIVINKTSNNLTHSQESNYENTNRSI